VVGCWHGYVSEARCRFAYGPAGTTATHFLLLHEIQIGFGFTLLVPPHLGRPGQYPGSHKTVVVAVIKVYNRIAFSALTLLVAHQEELSIWLVKI